LTPFAPILEEGTMIESTPQAARAADIDADIRRLEVGIRQLKVQYDMFFAGALKREPIEVRAQLEKIIKRHANSPIQKYAQRFHLNTLISRFNSLSELWSKTIRNREEGDRPAPALTELDVPREQLIARCRVVDSKGEAKDLRRLYNRFRESRHRLEADKPEISYEKFVRGLANQSKRLQKESGCAEIELRVVVLDCKVLLKARPSH
jgi:hypothetical protein